MSQDPNRFDRDDPGGAHTAGRDVHRHEDEVVEEDLIPEGSGKQFARGVGDDRVDERLVVEEPSEIVHGERVPQGSGKQFSRGVGEDTSLDDDDRIRQGSGKEYARGVDDATVDERMPGDPGDVPEGSGKQFGRDYGDDPEDVSRRR